MGAQLEPSLSEEILRVVDIIVSVAREWVNVEHSVRLQAEEETLAAANRFTEEALVFAINQQMSLLTREALQAWAARLKASEVKKVGVLNPGNIPLAGLQDFLGVLLSGHQYVGSVSSCSPVLLPAFSLALQERGLNCEVMFTYFDELISEVDAIIASGTVETMATVRKRASDAGMEDSQLLLRGHRFSIAVMDGRESEEDMERLAEDILLHEGLGCRNVALVWAPTGTDPDPLLEVMATYRATFPPHPESKGALEMQRAYLVAIDQPHAFADGLEFLFSKGEPEILMPLHIRWTEYSDINQVNGWIHTHRREIQLVVSPESMRELLPEGIATVEPGFAQRPELGWSQDGKDLGEFLQSI
ncbi:MAG: hypothetical protein BMS9Abin05_2029 [Rhodothermia bacterium]|nr:MAG: hypothetical protein BMS9Abin05_2029 [Rhodothermia bacterium]